MYDNAERRTYGDGFPALRRSSSAFLSAANFQNVSKAIVGLRVTPEITIDSRPLRMVFEGTLRLHSIERSTFLYGECEKAREEGQVECESCEVASFALLETGI